MPTRTTIGAVIMFVMFAAMCPMVYCCQLSGVDSWKTRAAMYDRRRVQGEEDQRNKGRTEHHGYPFGVCIDETLIFSNPATLTMRHDPV